MNMEELLKRRAELLEELGRIEAAIKEASEPLRAYMVRTHRNIRNTYAAGVQIYSSPSLTELADISRHEGYVSGAGIATLRANDLVAPRGDIQLLEAA